MRLLGNQPSAGSLIGEPPDTDTVRVSKPSGRRASEPTSFEPPSLRASAPPGFWASELASLLQKVTV